MSFNPETGAEVTDQETQTEVTDPETQTEVDDFNAKKADGTLYNIEDREFEEVGYLHTKKEEFTLTKDERPEAGKKYAFIEKGKEGNEGVEGKTELHYGNQIAYELLKLGYTVLFKKIDAVSELTTDDY